MSGACFGYGNPRSIPEDNSPAFSSSKSLQKKFVPLKPAKNGLEKTLLNSKTPARLPDEKPEKSKVDKEASLVKCHEMSAQGLKKDTESHWMVNWCALLTKLCSISFDLFFRRKPQSKKHKTWDGDAFIFHRGARLTLISETGKM